MTSEVLDPGDENKHVQISLPPATTTHHIHNHVSEGQFVRSQRWSVCSVIVEQQFFRIEHVFSSFLPFCTERGEMRARTQNNTAQINTQKRTQHKNATKKKKQTHTHTTEQTSGPRTGRQAERARERNARCCSKLFTREQPVQTVWEKKVPSMSFCVCEERKASRSSTRVAKY